MPFFALTVFKGGVIPLELANTTAGKVSMLEEISKTGLNSTGRDEVKIFSGAGIVSVLKRGVEVRGVSGVGGCVRVGLTLLVNVLVTVINLEGSH
jgi:hypothetical protein